jgi:hypothetical protein
MEIDWSNSVVLVNDRQLVLNLLDDVHNYELLMPVDVCEWLEPIHSTHCQQQSSDTDGKYGRKDLNGNGKRTAHTNGRRAARGNDDDDGDESSNFIEDHHQHQQLLGYCITFTNMPSFNLSFLNHLKQKYATRWLSALVLFPHKTAPCRLAITLRCENAFLQSALTSTIAASKRLRNLVQQDFADDDSTATTGGGATAENK